MIDQNNEIKTKDADREGQSNGDRLKELSDELEALEKSQQAKSSQFAGEKAHSQGLQVLGELLGGIFGGLGLGYLIDQWLGTKPWFLIVGILIGLAGSIFLIAKRGEKE